MSKICKSLLCAFCLATAIGFASQSAWSYGTKLYAKEMKTLEIKLEKLNKNFLSDLEIAEKRTQQDPFPKLSIAYIPKIRTAVGANMHPNDLARLALWVEKKDPGFSSSSYVYRYVFDTSVHRLGDLKCRRALQALKSVRLELKKRKHFDGHVAETVEAAERHQARPRSRKRQ